MIDDYAKLKDIDIEGWYYTDMRNIFLEIIDPSINEPTEGGEWCTNMTVYQAVTIGETTKLHEIDGLLKENMNDSTWRELIHMVEDCTGYIVIGRCDDDTESWLENLDTE